MMEQQPLPYVGGQMSHMPASSAEPPPSMLDPPSGRDHALLSSHDDPSSVYVSASSKSSLYGTGYYSGGGGTQAPRRALTSTALYLLKNWWEEVLCCIVNVACVIALVVLLRSYDGRPLPAWPLGITLNTVVAFLITVCRTLFIIPTAEVLSQAKWNWFKKSPRPLKDLCVFDDASRGAWGSLKLLIATKGRFIGGFAAVVLITSTATSTLTQSVITYPTRPVPVLGNETAISSRNTGYYWVTATSPSYRDVLFAASRGIYTPPDEVLAYEKPTCKTNNCTWNTFSSLAVCVDMKNVTGQLHMDAEAERWPNWTLPNGVQLERNNSLRSINISPAPTLSYNGTEVLKASIFDFFVIYCNGTRARAVEIVLHWCVNTYSVTVDDNVPVTKQVSSQTIVQSGETSVRDYNETINVTYLVTPDDVGATYVADGYGPAEIWGVLYETLSGYNTEDQNWKLNNGNSFFMTAIFRANIGLSSVQDTQLLDDNEWIAMRNVSQNIANGLTNALMNTNVYGTAWERISFVSVRWQWLGLLIAQVGLSIITLSVAVFQTAKLDIGIVKKSLLPALFAIDAREKAALEKELLNEEYKMTLGEKTGLDVYGISGELRRRGGNWVLGESTT